MPPRRSTPRFWARGEKRWPDLVSLAALAGAVLWYFWNFSRLTIEIHDGYGTSAFDIGIFDQGVWLLSRFRNPDVTITGRNLFADHTSFILLLVAPMYWVAPSPTTLLRIQAAAVSLSAIPIYLIGVRLLGSRPLATLLSVAYLLHPALGAANLENYHPDSFLALFVALMLYAAIEDRRRLLLVATSLCLIVKEDTVLIVLPIATWFMWRRDLRLGAAVGAGSIVYAVIAFGLIRMMNDGVDLQSWRIPFGGVAGTLEALLFHPRHVIDYLSQDGRLWYVWQMLAPSGFVFLVAPEIVATGTLVLGVNVMSTFVYNHLIAYHYVFSIVPTIGAGTVWAVSRVSQRQWRYVATAATVVSAVCAAFSWGMFSWSRSGEPGHWLPSNPTVQAIETIRTEVPPDAIVSAYHTFVPHIGHRQAVYMWPVPFKAVYWGRLNQEGQSLPFTDDIEYLFLPSTLGNDDQAIFNRIRDRYTVVAANQAATLYARQMDDAADAHR